MSDDSDPEPRQKRKRKVNRDLDDSSGSSSSGSPIIGPFSKRRRNKIVNIMDDSDSESGSPIDLNRRRRIARVNSDSSTASSDSDLVVRSKRTGRVVSDSDSDEADHGFEYSSSQWETDFSDNEVLKESESTNAAAKVPDAGVDSDSSDCNSDKCPICLLSFKTQEIASPESCDHIFCVECIQEWSKNMNTCPVDRQKYSLILVRKSINGKIIRQIPIQDPNPQNEIEIIEDPTFCEICGSSDREDRMLLCDGCDLGFHLECLTPPLEDVPAGAWYCPDCPPPESLIQLYDIQMMINDVWRSQGGIRRRISSSRLIPRTSHTERLRNRIRNNRSINNDTSQLETHSAPGYEDSNRVTVTAASSTTNSRRRKKKKSKRKTYRTVYTIDDATGETVCQRVKIKRKGKKKKKRQVIQPKTVKKRLAIQLGMCVPRSVPQNLPDVKVQPNPSGINHQRYQAGIPTLNIFGNSDALDYFSPSEDENDISGPGYLTRRAPNRSDISVFRRAARRKAVLLPPTVSSSTDVLGSILDCQAKFHSKSTVFSLDKDGKFNMINKKSSNNRIHNSNNDNDDDNGDRNKGGDMLRHKGHNNNNNHVRDGNLHNNGSNDRNIGGNNNGGNDLRLADYTNSIRRRPGYSNNGAGNNRPSSTYQPQNDYQHGGGHSNYGGYMPRPSYSHQGPLNYSSHQNYDVPQDYSQRTLSAAYDYQPQPVDNNKKDDKNKGKGNSSNDTPRSNTPNSESEVDIYSDIENELVSTSRLEDFYLKPPPTPPILRTPNPVDDDDRDSEADMVIDTEKADLEKYDPEQDDSDKYDPELCDPDQYDPAVPSDFEEKEEGYVTSTADSIVEEDIPSNLENQTVTNAADTPEIQSQDVQSSNAFDEQICEYKAKEVKEKDPDEEDDLDSEDGCPNFSIYSKESINLAKTTDLTLMQESNVEMPTNQVEEISSTPDLKNSSTNDWEGGEKSDWEDEKDNAVVKNDTKNDWENDDEMEKIVENNKIKPVGCVTNDWEEDDKNDWAEDERSAWEESEKILGKDKDGEQENSFEKEPSKKATTKNKTTKSTSGLYSDSEDETVVKKGTVTKFALADLNNMTEDISEEERSYTPENKTKYKEGLEGLDTEMISDEDRNDFDESHELKTISDGDALEINAKESEIDFTRPEDYEEGEIVDKLKSTKSDEIPESEERNDEEEETHDASKSDNVEEVDKDPNKENEPQNKDTSFKKLSKNSKERNYRGDKEKDNQRGRSYERNKEKERERRDRRKEKRKEIERYDVRALIAEKPRRLKDKFGRDIRQTPSRSKSKSATPPPAERESLSRTRQSPPRTRQSPSRTRQSLSRTRQSPSRTRQSPPRIRQSPPRRIRRARSREVGCRSASRSRSRSLLRKRSKSGLKKRRRSLSKSREKRKKPSRERNKAKTRKARSHSRHRSPSPPERRRRDWKKHSREWSPSISPSWTPPRVLEAMQPHNLTVILPNNANKKKKDKRKRSDKKSSDRQRKRRRNDKTPPPSKEVFASGDNILVSVSFNKENETRDVSTTRKRKEEELARRRREKRKRLNKKNFDLSGIKPVAVIDLERSPFREITSPKDVIVLTDSDNDGNELSNIETGICDSSQQVASPERCITSYTTGPKTPPEPQVKFSLSSKQPQLRAISNPLGDADDLENDIDVQEELDERLNENIYKGPNTPPEPPNSPPSSPDAYDPFEPTKSRSPTPEPLAVNPPNDSVIPCEENREESILLESIRTGISEIMDKPPPIITLSTPEALKSHTPPITEIQPADSQSSLHPATPDSNLDKSPDMSHNSLSQSTQPQTPTFSTVNAKPVAQTIPFSPVPITSTPVSTTLAPPRINILNNTVINPPSVATSIPQRIVLPNILKSSPVKISPTKAAVKSTPIKPMPTKNIMSKQQRKPTTTTTNNRSQNNNTEPIDLLDFDSPYSPGSSDYEDLFEPPTETITASKSKSKTTSKSAGKIQNIFDVLFGSGPINKTFNKSKSPTKYKKIAVTPTKGKGTKLVGVKLDEDSLKILDDLPSSAVEMQVKDKFLKKLNRQERVVEEVKLVLKPYYNKKRINKEEYKDIMRRAVPKICHNKTGEINPTKIKNLVEAYVKKIRHSKKVTSSSSINPLKI